MQENFDPCVNVHRSLDLYLNLKWYKTSNLEQRTLLAEQSMDLVSQSHMGIFLSNLERI